MTTSNQGLTRLQLGCGLNTPAGWINVDGSWNARLAKYPALRKAARAVGAVPADKLDIPWSRDIVIHDVRKPLPFATASMDGVYASHLLEHLYHDEAERLLRECLRVLKPGGAVRIVVPDLRSIVREYWSQTGSGDSPAPSSTSGDSPADRVNQRLLLRPPTAPRGSWAQRIYTATQDFHSHKWMYDAESLARLIARAGFAQVEEKAFHQSRIAGIDEVEHASRVLNGEGIAVEGVRP